LRHGEENAKSPIAPLSFSTWGDRGVFVAQDQTVVCIDLASGKELWSRKLSPDADKKESFAMHDFSLEIRVVPSAKVPSHAPHLEFFEARSVICLCDQQTLASLDLETGNVQWRVGAKNDFGAKFWGGIVVLPHGCIATLRENKAPCAYGTLLL
jgi:outer membrane protein assembly factor BamB